MDKIIVRGAKTHNLKNIDLDLPRDQLIVITGLSGSGKSSLAFDTLYAEGQRRYVESLSTYARQFLSLMEKPDIEHIEGLSPAISIEQKSTSHNPRSTVGTVTEIYDYLRLLFARIGTPHCPKHQQPLEAQTISQMVDHILTIPTGTKIMLLAPVVQNRKGEHQQLLSKLKADGFLRVRINQAIYEIDDVPKINKNQKHTIEVVVDRLKIKEGLTLRLTESIETALRLSDGTLIVSGMDDEALTLTFSSKFACSICEHSLPELEPRLFSFNNPAGACSSCDGLGKDQYFDPNKIITDDSRSLAEGAIRGWDKKTFYYYKMLESLAEHFNFDLDKPYKKLSKKIKQVLLFGTEEPIQFFYSNDHGDSISRTHRFEGIIPNMERRFRDTESQSVRDELNKFISHTVCSSCNGSRLNANARHVLVEKQNLPQITALPIADTLTYFAQLKLQGQKKAIADKIIKEIQDRLRFLVNVGLNYLTLDRSADSLSGGEAQRIRLASQIGAGLVGVMYILDEPSIGLHQRDNARLLNSLIDLKELGNTVIVVEHDEDAIRNADFIVDIGPRAGTHGGEIIAQGTIDDIMSEPNSLTGQYLSGAKCIALPKQRTSNNPSSQLVLTGASGNNLKKVSLSIPTGLLTCITGVSGSGKSTLINSTLYPATARIINKAHTLQPSPFDTLSGLDLIDKVIDIDQSPIGRTPRSNPATYTGIFTPIRELFAQTPEARARGYKPGRFSFNVKGGRCESCQGDGMIKVEMHFLPDIFVPCDSCQGARYNRETLGIRYKGKSISEILSFTVEEALTFFQAIPSIFNRLKTLDDVGLSYITLGQSATTLSGGEAQRVKLSKELAKRATGKTLYILDEPTTGLHFHDISQLLLVLHRLRDQGNTMVVIEHNLDVIKTADWVIDMGPEGGNGGGQIIAEGTPEAIAANKHSHTGRFLKPLLQVSSKKAQNKTYNEKPTQKRETV